MEEAVCLLPAEGTEETVNDEDEGEGDLVLDCARIWGDDIISMPLDDLRGALKHEGYAEERCMRGLTSRVALEILASAADMERGTDYEIGVDEQPWLVLRDKHRLRQLASQPAERVLTSFARCVASWRRAERAALLLQVTVARWWRARQAAADLAAMRIQRAWHRSRRRRKLAELRALDSPLLQRAERPAPAIATDAGRSVEDSTPLPTGELLASDPSAPCAAPAAAAAPATVTTPAADSAPTADGTPPADDPSPVMDPPLPPLPKLLLPKRPQLTDLTAEEDAALQALMSDEDLRTSRRMFGE